jgi:hypothetical protein
VPISEKKAAAQQGPSRGLYLGLAITIFAVLAYAGYITLQFAGLRQLQSELVDRNRKDSLQLLRIQNDLNSLGLAMRDMLDDSEPYLISAWIPQFERIRTDLQEALREEELLAKFTRTSDQRLYLSQALNQFWDASGRMFAVSHTNSRYPAAQAGGAEFHGIAFARTK